MTLLPDVPTVHGPFVLRLSRHLSRLLLKGLGSYRRLGAVLPLFTEFPRADILGNSEGIKRAGAIRVPGVSYLLAQLF